MLSKPNLVLYRYDRRRKVGASAASDIWSLGCLFYELLTGDFLFYDNDWVRFFIRVTSPQEVRSPYPKKKKKVTDQSTNVYC